MEQILATRISTTLKPTRRKLKRRKKIMSARSQSSRETIKSDNSSLEGKDTEEEKDNAERNATTEDTYRIPNFVLPNLGETILMSNNAKDDPSINHFVMKSAASGVNPMEEKAFTKKHSLNFGTRYPYFTRYPPYNKSFYKPVRSKFFDDKAPYKPLRKNFNQPPMKKPVNFLENVVHKSIHLLNQSIPSQRKNKPTINTNDFDEIFYTPDIHSFTQKTPLSIDEMSQEFLLAHLVLVSIPLLFTGKILEMREIFMKRFQVSV